MAAGGHEAQLSVEASLCSVNLCQLGESLSCCLGLHLFLTVIGYLLMIVCCTVLFGISYAFMSSTELWIFMKTYRSSVFMSTQGI